MPKPQDQPPAWAKVIVSIIVAMVLITCLVTVLGWFVTIILGIWA